MATQGTQTGGPTGGWRRASEGPRRGGASPGREGSRLNADRTPGPGALVSPICDRDASRGVGGARRGRRAQRRDDSPRVPPRHRGHQVLPRAHDLPGEPEGDQRGACLPASPQSRLELQRHRAALRRPASESSGRELPPFGEHGRPNLRAAVRAGVVGASSHSGRRWFMTELARCGVHPRIIQQRGGNSVACERRAWPAPFGAYPAS
jgi:hypothetical protein